MCLNHLLIFLIKHTHNPLTPKQGMLLSTDSANASFLFFVPFCATLLIPLPIGHLGTKIKRNCCVKCTPQRRDSALSPVQQAVSPLKTITFSTVKWEGVPWVSRDVVYCILFKCFILPRLLKVYINSQARLATALRMALWSGVEAVVQRIDYSQCICVCQGCLWVCVCVHLSVYRCYSTETRRGGGRFGIINFLITASEFLKVLTGSAESHGAKLHVTSHFPCNRSPSNVITRPMVQMNLYNQLAKNILEIAFYY